MATYTLVCGDRGERERRRKRKGEREGGGGMREKEGMSMIERDKI
jgi:hypothetical protein